MAFQKFTDTTKSYKSKISIRSNGTIGLSSGSVFRYLKSNHKHATLYYDPDSKKIGIKPTTAEEEGSHTLHRGKTGAWIGARRFLDFIDFQAKTTQRFEPEWDEDEKMLVISLGKSASSEES